MRKHTSKGENSGDRGSTVRAAFPLYIEYPTKTLGVDAPKKPMTFLVLP